MESCRAATAQYPDTPPLWRTAMTDESKREDLDHKPENAGKVGEKNKELNKQGEQPRPGTSPDPQKDNSGS
ncbi:hypothetical protein ALP22_04780 [Pseudomonas coronafaciens pv. porri]|nr:hypothetical protein ALO38_04599 [Pseudomonas coronafaciens pv. zizaniae]RMM32264.1 hypothetical protein ALQ80_04672 [Pseudomonas coronafaciens pv. oryzae]RMU84762.1 hypothetical protein ALP22_04780 [Pseudomonas coronafaciens pv. porri]